MLNITNLMIEGFVDELLKSYTRSYGKLNPHYGDIIGWAGWMALENIANSDALYHNVEHTIMVSLVGQEILKGKHLMQGGVSANDWMHFVIALLCHDIGYVRGICRADNGPNCYTGKDDEMIMLAKGATDAALTPYHVDRGKTFVQERFGGHDIIDSERIASYLELTRFPIPDDSDYQDTEDFSGLLRAADLIGQLADPNYLRKLPALFYEFEETGTNKMLGYKNSGDLRESYAMFYWKVVNPYIGNALNYLSITQEGKQWIASLYRHIFAIEHKEAVTRIT
ncbi:Metal-dependent phosphohydrolase [Candidatus Magnetomoraceae bacterium gMMP-15]